MGRRCWEPALFQMTVPKSLPAALLVSYIVWRYSSWQCSTRAKGAHKVPLADNVEDSLTQLSHAHSINFLLIWKVALVIDRRARRKIGSGRRGRYPIITCLFVQFISRAAGMAVYGSGDGFLGTIIATMVWRGKRRRRVTEFVVVGGGGVSVGVG